MELFATDRDRLAFLLETDAALDLDFEAIETQAEVQDDKPARIPISAIVWQGIDAVRLSGQTNMLDLPAIDRLEGFHPGGLCLYRRVLTSAQVHGIVLPAWFYVGEYLSGKLTPLGGSHWSRRP